jgi:hypothetical protein
MKISSFYYNDMSDYDNFLEKFINDIDEKFFGTGYSSLNIGRFINFFRTEITKYIDIKFQKKVHLVVLLPKNDQPFIEKSLTSSGLAPKMKAKKKAIEFMYPDAISTDGIQRLGTTNMLDKTPKEIFTEMLRGFPEEKSLEILI